MTIAGCGTDPVLCGERRQRAVIAIAQVLSLSCWFSASAVTPELRSDLGIGPGVAVLLTSSVQLGFVLGALGSAAFNLADRVPPTRLYAASAGAAALCTALVASCAQGTGSAILFRLLTGVALAGVYPVGLKLVASWSSPRMRGRAFGLLIGALTLGSALPQLIAASTEIDWREALFVAASITALGGLLMLTLVRPGPHLEPTASKLEVRYALRMLRERGPLLANLGYYGHMWELYAFWAWLPTFLMMGQRDLTVGDRPLTGLTAFAVIGLAGLAGCLVGGWASDRFGRSPSAVVAMVVSGSCCLLSPLVFGRTGITALVFLLIWGAAVIADSGVFSTALSETADRRFVGTALTAQTAIGFLLTAASIHLVYFVGSTGSWRYAFLILAVGPLAGAVAMTKFSTIESTHANRRTETTR